LQIATAYNKNYANKYTIQKQYKKKERTIKKNIHRNIPIAPKNCLPKNLIPVNSIKQLTNLKTKEPQVLTKYTLNS
jgi:hypothetical protein